MLSIRAIIAKKERESYTSYWRTQSHHYDYDKTRTKLNIISQITLLVLLKFVNTVIRSRQVYPTMV